MGHVGGGLYVDHIPRGICWCFNPQYRGFAGDEDCGACPFRPQDFGLLGSLARPADDGRAPPQAVDAAWALLAAGDRA